jgi:hypothetical protein
VSTCSRQVPPLCLLVPHPVSFDDAINCAVPVGHPGRSSGWGTEWNSKVPRSPTRSAANRRSRLGVGDGLRSEGLPIAHAKRSRPTKSARGGGRIDTDCVTHFEGSDPEGIAHPGFRFAPPGATVPSPAARVLAVVSTCVHRLPTRSAADPRSGREAQQTQPVGRSPESNLNAAGRTAPWPPKSG